MDKIRRIIQLSLCGEVRQKDIAKGFGLSQSTVSTYLARAAAHGIDAERLATLSDEQLQALVRPSRAGLTNKPLPDLKHVHRELRCKHVTLELLYEEYAATHKDGLGRSQFYALYRAFKQKLNPVLRRNHKAGDAMFVDFAGPTVPIYCAKSGLVALEAQIFVAVLGASNYTFADAIVSQKVAHFIDANIRALEFFGGVPGKIVCDNLKSGVIKACRYEPQLNETFERLAAHYDTAIIPTRPRKPKDKAKVEVAVQIVERWILARIRKVKFFSLVQLKDVVASLLDDLNHRPFKKLDGCRASWFATEREALKPLPRQRFEPDLWKKAKVNIDYHIEFADNFYSTPHRYVREEVMLRATAQIVEIFRDNKRIASHQRSYGQGIFVTDPEHRPKAHQVACGMRPSQMIGWAHDIGPKTAALVERILFTNVHPEQGYRTCLGIMRLGKTYDNDRLEAAAERALRIGALRYASVKSILDKGLDQKPLPGAACDQQDIEHENIRGGDYYKNLH